MEPWRLKCISGGSDGALEAQIEPWRPRLSPGGSDGALEAHVEPWEYPSMRANSFNTPSSKENEEARKRLYIGAGRTKINYIYKLPLS